MLLRLQQLHKMLQLQLWLLLLLSGSWLLLQLLRLLCRLLLRLPLQSAGEPAGLERRLRLSTQAARLWLS